jgi:hypothetical protein
MRPWNTEICDTVLFRILIVSSPLQDISLTFNYTWETDSINDFTKLVGNPESKILLEKLTVAQLVKQFQHFIQPQISFQWWQQQGTGPHFRPHISKFCLFNIRLHAFYALPRRQETPYGHDHAFICVSSLSAHYYNSNLGITLNNIVAFVTHRFALLTSWTVT